MSEGILFSLPSISRPSFGDVCPRENAGQFQSQLNEALVLGYEPSTHLLTLLSLSASNRFPHIALMHTQNSTQSAYQRAFHNTVHNENMDGLEEYLQGIEGAGVAGIIVADPLIIETCKRVAPKLEVHLSTQQSLSNWKAVQFWKEEGLERVVLARETSALEIKEMKEKVDIEIETFIHGAMCIAYSGRCVLSNHMTARDSNRGGCCQSCRWDYDLYKLEGSEEAPLFSEEDAPFAMSPKDLKLIESIPQMIEMGIDSLKIEGRMKSIHYVATVVSVYRKVIDAYCADPDNFVIQQEWLDELDKCANRDTAPAFFEGVPGTDEQMFGIHGKKTTFSLLTNDAFREKSFAKECLNVFSTFDGTIVIKTNIIDVIRTIVFLFENIAT
ncbi:U32 family peptidase [Escherichia coli]|nr:U32 family peptidase [Escherichia coli]